MAPHILGIRSVGSAPNPGTSLIKIIRWPQVGQVELLAPSMNIAELPELGPPPPSVRKHGVDLRSLKVVFK